MARWWRRTPLVPALRKQCLVDLCEFKPRLIYIESQDSYIVRACLDQNKAALGLWEDSADKRSLPANDDLSSILGTPVVEGEKWLPAQRLRAHIVLTRMWWCTSLFTALRRQRQSELHRETLSRKRKAKTAYSLKANPSWVPSAQVRQPSHSVTLLPVSHQMPLCQVSHSPLTENVTRLVAETQALFQHV